MIFKQRSYLHIIGSTIFLSKFCNRQLWWYFDLLLCIRPLKIVRIVSIIFHCLSTSTGISVLITTKLVIPQIIGGFSWYQTQLRSHRVNWGHIFWNFLMVWFRQWITLFHCRHLFWIICYWRHHIWLIYWWLMNINIIIY